MQGSSICGCPHHKVPASLIVLFGLLFLLGALDIVGARLVELGWPVLVILAGLMKLGERMGWCKCCSGSCGDGTCC